MGKLTYTDFVEADLGKLGTAVSDWKSAVDGLKSIAADARSGMQAKSDAARWSGANAEVTRDFVRKTTKEIDDLHTEADSIWSVLDDAHRELTGLQTRVKAEAGHAKDKGIAVSDGFDGTVTLHYVHHRGDDDKRTQQELDELHGFEDRINAGLGKAAGIDADVSRALAKAHGNSANDAGHARYSSLNDAQAEEAVRLAKLGSGMSDKQLAELNRLLSQNSREKNGEFATKFYQGLGGPGEALKFYGQMSVDGTDDQASATRLDAVKALQRNMGVSLANATEPDAPKGLDGPKFHVPASWGEQFRKLGTQPVGWQRGMMNKPYGYQILGGMLRYGDYDPRFINPIAEHLTQLHHDDPGFFIGNGPTNGDENYGFNPSGRLGSGNEPLTGALEALGHSPEASQKFFTDPPTAYNEDGTVDHGGDPGIKSYLDEFTDKDFHWNIDRNDANLIGAPDAESALNDGPNALGHALESATTGRPYDSDATADAVRHTPERAALTHQIVEKFGAHPDLIRHNENGDLEDKTSGPLYAMRDSLGDITAEYMGDFQRSMYGEGDDSTMFPVFGESADLDSGHAQRLLREVGQDPHGYAAVTAAQHAYTAQVVDDVVKHAGTHSEAVLSERMESAVSPGSTMAGIMSHARSDAIIDYHTAADKDFNDAADDKQKWVNRILGMGVDKAAAAVPVVGPAISWASEDIQSSVMDSIHHDTTVDAENEASRTYSHGRDASIEAARQAVQHACRGTDVSPETISSIERAARTQAGIAHDSGSTWDSSGDAS